MNHIGDRITTEDHPNSTTIIIHPLKKQWKEFLLTFWLFGFTFVGMAVLYVIFTGVETLNTPDGFSQEDYDNQRIYLFVFIGFWAYFEYKTLKAWTWYKFGKELILIDSDSVHVKKSRASIGKSHRFLFGNIKKLSVRQLDDTTFGHFFENSYWTLGIDKITFEHFGKSFSFARRLDDKDAKLLIRFMDDRIRKMIKKRA